MEQIQIFLRNYYYIFYIICGISFLALIGFIVEKKRIERELKKTEKLETIKLDTGVNQIPAQDDSNDKIEII